MITLATLQDEMVDGQRRAAGRQIRKIVAICCDNYNLVRAEGTDPARLVGKQFFGKLAHLGPFVESDFDDARRQMIDFFRRFSGEQVGDLTWAEIDKQFDVPKRRSVSSAVLLLYDALKEKGWKDTKEKESD
jgi:hypothetical protein